MTVRMLRDAGADVEHRAQGAWHADTWRVHPGALRPGVVRVEPDLSSSAPFLAAALVTGGSVTIRDWAAESIQPVGQILSVLTRMGATCAVTHGGLTVTGSGAIRGIVVNLRDVGEVTPVLAAVAALAATPSRFTGIGHLRRHETDRLAALATEINALGGDVTELADGLEIRPRPLSADGPAGGVFASYDDHRMVMAAAVLGLVVPGIVVPDAVTVGKTFPEFASLWAGMLRQPAL
jgi:3-phosphoshikimate 1-carboxyvinyltransferase